MELRGITIKLYEKTKTGEDVFGKPIYKEEPVEIENVLVAPASTVDVTNNTNLSGDKAVYILGIPKGDTHDWVNKTVEMFGMKFKTVGIPLEGIEAMIPLSWNKKVTVEYYG